MGPEQEQDLARKSRMVSIVIAATIVLWLGAQFIGKQFGLAGRYALLFDFAALAGLFWSMVVIFQVWRARRED
ncbi:MAG: DUF5337 domain-containing protein [Paracoccaceae bacterium]